MPAAARSKLLKDVQACRLCEPELPLGANPILQYGTTARVLIAGQAPGRRAHEAGIPFKDPSGDRLRKWLAVSEDEFYDPRKFAILPMGFCFPGTGKGGDLPPRPECAETWRKRLLRSLRKLELTLVIGQYSVAWHLPEWQGRPLSTVVADWKSHWPRVVPMPHPSPRNQRWLKQHPWFEREVVPKLQRRVRLLIGD